MAKNIFFKMAIIFIIFNKMVGFGNCLTSNFLNNSISEKKSKSFLEFITPYVPLDPNSKKINIPGHFKHVKLDIGLSYSAPKSQRWLSNETDLIVFGFEPHPYSINSILKGAVKLAPFHGEPLEKKHIGKSFFLIPCALGLSNEDMIKFYMTKKDCGCSSIYEPNYLEVADVTQVPIFFLSNFFDLFPWETHPIIEYIKIDAQGSDLDIAKSGGDYLKDRVVFITLEAENYHYKNTSNSEKEIENYMYSIGFVRYESSQTNDPTYLNTRFQKYVEMNRIFIY